MPQIIKLFDKLIVLVSQKIFNQRLRVIQRAIQDAIVVPAVVIVVFTVRDETINFFKG